MKAWRVLLWMLCVLWGGAALAYTPGLTLQLDASACPGECVAERAIRGPKGQSIPLADRLVWVDKGQRKDARIVLTPETIEWWVDPGPEPRFVLRVDARLAQREDAFRDLWGKALIRVFNVMHLAYLNQYDPDFPLVVRLKTSGDDIALYRSDTISSGFSGSIDIMIGNRSAQPVKVKPQLIDKEYELVALAAHELAPGQAAIVSWRADHVPLITDLLLEVEVKTGRPKFSMYTIRHKPGIKVPSVERR
jgi:hypothetical protein